MRASSQALKATFHGRIVPELGLNDKLYAESLFAITIRAIVERLGFRRRDQMNSAKRVLSFQRSLSSKIASSGSIVLNRAGSALMKITKGHKVDLLFRATPGDPTPLVPSSAYGVNESGKAISSAGFQKRHFPRSPRIN